MVNFNLRLRDNIYAEWQDEYINYKKLKRNLKQQKNVYLLQQNKEKQTTHIPMKTILHPIKQDDKLALNTNELQSLISIPTSLQLEFQQALLMEYKKVDEAYNGHLSHFFNQFILLEQQYRPKAPLMTQESVKNSLVELHRLANQLNNFALLNYTGFIKIVKKHDKVLPHQIPLQTSELQRLATYSFAQATGVNDLLLRIETSYAKWFCDGNRSVAIALLVSKKEDPVNWEHVYIGVKIGTVFTLMVWIFWDSIIVPSLKSGRKRHIMDLVMTPAYPVYRGIGGVLLLHWLIGVSLYVWRSARINYRYIFELDPRMTRQYHEVFSEATNMSIVYLVNLIIYYKVVNGYFTEFLLPRGYYPLGLFLYTIYFYVFRNWRNQGGLVRTLLEIFLAPCYPVTFFHTFVGDYLTSTVKVSQDLWWSVCFFTSQEFLQEGEYTMNDSSDSSGSTDIDTTTCANNYYFVTFLVPLICALPLWWRFLQSLRRIYDTGTWWPNLPNAVKYALAQVVALFGLFHPFYGYGPHPQLFQFVWLTLFALSSSYTWLWDVTMDWGLGRRKYNYLSDRRMFSRAWYYYLAIGADLILRFAWTLTLIPPQSTGTSIVMYFQPFTMVGELIRRTFWSFFRLENEHLRNTLGFRRVDFIPLHYDHGVGTTEDSLRAEMQTKKHMEGRVLILKIILILCLVLGLSLAAVLVDNN